MIVSCPACAARYKINESKISARGAKITCPRSAHKFVVFRDPRREAPTETPAGAKVPEDLAERDFNTVGVR